MKEIEGHIAKIYEKHKPTDGYHPEYRQGWYVAFEVIKDKILSEVTIEVVCHECSASKALDLPCKCKGTGKETITLKQAIERLQSE